MAGRAEGPRLRMGSRRVGLPHGGGRPGGRGSGRPEESAGDRGWRAGQGAVREERARGGERSAIWLNLPEEQANLED